MEGVKSADQILYKETIFEYLEENEDIKIDKLIIEGTNIGRPLTPIGPNEAQQMMSKLLEKERPALTAIHELGIEGLFLISSVAKAQGKELLLASPRLIKILDTLRSINPRVNRELERMVALGDIVKESTQLDRIPMSEVKRESSKYCMVADIARLDEIFRRFEPLGEHLTMAPVILMISEPADEEAIFDAERLTRWLSLYGLQPYNIRISGHYYPHELRTVIKKMKPKEVMPIHTLFPECLSILSRTT